MQQWITVVPGSVLVLPWVGSVSGIAKTFTHIVDGVPRSHHDPVTDRGSVANGGHTLRATVATRPATRGNTSRTVVSN
jgi:hypothetical protein